MSCEENIQALIDAAALGQAPESRVAKHVKRCRQCQARLEREQQLFEAIDSALRTRLSEAPRTGFLARASARLSKEPTNSSGASPAWAAVPVLVLALLASTRPWIKSRQTIVAATPAPPVARMQRNTSSPTSARTAKPRPAVAPSRESFNQSSGIKVAASREPEVLVPPDEQKAFAQFVARVAGQDVMAAAVVNRAPDKTIPKDAALPQVPSVDLAQLEPMRRDDSVDEIDGSE